MAKELGRIAFSRWTPGKPECLFVMCADGTGVTQLTSGEHGHSYCPAWSPDGRRLCFVSRRDGYSSLYVIEADGSQEVRLTAARCADDDYPAWSLDGRTIAFSRGNCCGAENLWLVDVESGDERPLTTGGHMDFRPAWSPDGRLIAFRRSLAEPSGIYVIPAGGGAAQYLARGRDPCWSPAGDRLACSHGEGLWIVPVDQEQRSAGVPVPITLEARDVDRYPSWSAEGTHLVFEREEVRAGATTWRLMTITAEGKELRDLGEGRMPDWSPAVGE